MHIVTYSGIAFYQNLIRLRCKKKVARNGVLIGRMLYFKLYYEEINEMLVFSLTFNIINYLTGKFC